MTSSFPSLSQSIKPTPPLIDSIMYRLAEEERCEAVSPACLLTSPNRGVGGAALGLCAQAVQQKSRTHINFTLCMEKRYGSTVGRPAVPPAEDTDRRVVSYFE